MWPFKNNKRLQNCLVITEDDRIVESALQVEKKGYMVDHSTSEAWVLHPGSLIKKHGTSFSYALVDERDAAPIFLNGRGPTRKDIKDEIDTIAKEARKEAMYEIQRSQTKDKLAGIFRFTILMFTIMVVVCVMAALFMSGSINLPF